MHTFDHMNILSTILQRVTDLFKKWSRGKGYKQKNHRKRNPNDFYEMMPNPKGSQGNANWTHIPLIRLTKIDNCNNTLYWKDAEKLTESNIVEKDVNFTEKTKPKNFGKCTSLLR